MGLLSRIRDVLRANINDLISRAEDPEKMLNAALEEMQKQLIEAKSRVAMSIADEKRLQKQFEQQKAKAEDWQRKAQSAVQAGRDDLAVEALDRKGEHEAAAAQFMEQLRVQKSAVEELKKALSALSSKLEETKRRKTILLARAKRAEAQRQLANTLSAAHETSASERLERLEARVERAEAEAGATWEISALGEDHQARDLASEIDALGAGNGRADLVALKDQMRKDGLLPAGEEQKALPSGEDASEPPQKAEPEDDEDLASYLPPVSDDDPSEDVAAVNQS